MRGSQEPQISVEPQRVGTNGTDAALLMEAYNCALDPWQKRVVDCWMGTDEDDNYVVTSAGLAVPRQNGKNVCLDTRELYGLAIDGERILHTAHQVKTSEKSFRNMVGIFTDIRYPEIMELVKKIRFTNGKEAIELNNGGSIEFMARSRQAARGFQGISLVVFDEAQELQDDQIEAILATLSASATGTRQIIYTGTPPYPGCPGTVFRRRRTNCIKAPGPHDAWHEWGVKAKSVGEINIGDSTLWYMTNPAMGVRLSEDFTKEELRTMTADGFARERLGWWSPVLEEQTDFAVDHKQWKACMSAQMAPTGKKALGIKFSSDGSVVSLCGAVIPESGPARISLIAVEPTGKGTRWLADWLNARYEKVSCVAIDGRNGPDVLIDRIEGTWKAKGSVIRMKTNDVIAAASVLTEALAEQSVTWFEKHELLNESAITSVKRKIGGGWGFGGDNSTPIEAAAIALWAAKTTKRNPKKKMRIG